MSSSGSPASRRLVLSALMVAMAMALAAAESMLIPPLPIPGLRLGLANIVTLVCFSLFPRRTVLAVVAVRLVLTGLVLGSFLTPTFLMGATGALLSFCPMAVLHGRKQVSLLGMSLAGAAFHNLGQVLAAALLMSTWGIVYYLPWLLLWSVPTGLLTGIAARAAVHALSRAMPQLFSKS